MSIKQTENLFSSNNSAYYTYLSNIFVFKTVMKNAIEINVFNYLSEKKNTTKNTVKTII
jgi:hypothetical protein